MSRLRPFLLLLLLLFPFVALHAAQQSTPQPQPRLEITGINASAMPSVTVDANVYDTLDQPVQGLTASNFTITGDLAGKAQISKVENITDNNLPFATVLAIDISTSMAGTPLDDVKQAARAYVQSVRDNDPVAIITFASHVTIAQNYTTDKNALNKVIDSLNVAGETALYQGSYEAVDLAANSPTPRRAVILLSDGAEYGNISKVGRGAAAEEALLKGVPVYTIGLGFGVDRSYLQQLSTSTNAHFNETPTPAQLTQIYTSLAAQLRSQYVITLNAPLALDGTNYALGLQVTTPQGTASATATLRAPIPVPIVSFSPINGTLTQPTTVTATILHDDALKTVTFTVSGQQPVTASKEPYTFTIDPAKYPPGNYTLTASATDNNGDTGTAATGFTIGALPSQIALSPDLASLNEIAKPTTVTVQSTGQTPAASVTVDFNNSSKPTTLTAPFSFTIDPLQFQPGANSVVVSVTNQGGVTSSQTFPFKVAALPPQVTISGLQDGQTINAPINITVQTTSQTPVMQLNVSASEYVLSPNADGSYTLDPTKLPSGDNALVVQATTSNQQLGQAQVNFVVPALPPTIIVNGLMAGEVLHEDRAVSLDFISQEPVIHVAFFIDGADLAHEIHTPYGVTIKVLDYAPGAHILRLIADEANGQESTLDLPFSIAPEPAETATATAVFATQSALATVTESAAMTAISVQATQSAHSTATEAAQISQTAVEAADQATATQAAQITSTHAAEVSATAAEIVALQATATQVADQATQAAHATATEVAQVSQTAVEAAVQATATATTIRATQVEQATQSSQATATEVAQVSQTAVEAAAQATATATTIRATQVEQATQSSQATATQAAQNTQATATSAAGATQLANNLATLNAEITATRAAANATATQAVANATATQNTVNATATQAVINATATQNLVNSTATQAAVNATATQNLVNATATQAAANVTATQGALQTQVIDNLATLNAEITGTAVNRNATATQQAIIIAAGNEQATQQTITNSTSTAVAQATGTQIALQEQGTQVAFNVTSTQSALDITATQAAIASATQGAGATATQVEQATISAQSTLRSAAEAQIQEATLDTLATANAQAQLESLATQSARATRDAASTATEQTNATATAVQATQVQINATATSVEATEAQATQDAQATATQVQATAVQATEEAQATATQAAANTSATQSMQATFDALSITATQLVVNATATRDALETQAAVDATSTQIAANATSQSSQATQIAVGTMIAQVTATEQQIVAAETATANANATATQSAAMTETIDAATLDTRLTAIGPTTTPLTGGAQNALTLTPQPSPTLTEVQAQQPPIETNIAPIAIVLIVIIVVIVVLVLILRRPSPPSTPPRR